MWNSRAFLKVFCSLLPHPTPILCPLLPPPQFFSSVKSRHKALMPFQNDNLAHMWGWPPVNPMWTSSLYIQMVLSMLQPEWALYFYLCFQIFRVNYFLALGLLILNRKPELILHSERFSNKVQMRKASPRPSSLNDHCQPNKQIFLLQMGIQSKIMFLKLANIVTL